MKTLFAIILFPLLFCSCGSNDATQQQIAGIYVREISWEVTHPETGKVLGQSTLRDTLFILESGERFEIRQSKWRLNGFDQQGWQDQRHAEDRPTPAYEAVFDRKDGYLRPASPGWAVALHVEVEKGMLYQGSNRQQPYRKVP